jgi:hypothetical protein
MWTVADPAQVAGDEAGQLAAYRRLRDELRARIAAELLVADEVRRARRLGGGQ